MSQEGTGKCLCGQVSFTVKSMSQHVGACHCGMCARWAGGPLMAVDCGTEVVFNNEDLITVYNSSEWAERGFCSHCGSHLFYRLKQSLQHMIPAGLFDDNSQFVLGNQVFIDRKPGFYEFANKTATMTEAEVFAKYGA